SDASHEITIIIRVTGCRVTDCSGKPTGRAFDGRGLAAKSRTPPSPKIYGQSTMQYEGGGTPKPPHERTSPPRSKVHPTPPTHDRLPRTRPEGYPQRLRRRLARTRPPAPRSGGPVRRPYRFAQDGCLREGIPRALFSGGRGRGQYDGHRRGPHHRRQDPLYRHL